MKRHRSCLLISVFLLIFLGCGEEQDVKNPTLFRERAKPPSQISIRGIFSSQSTLNETGFGGSKLVSLRLSASVVMTPLFPASLVSWGKASTTEVVFPALGSCELTGVEVIFSSDSLAEIYLWGWDKPGEPYCADLLNATLQTGITWRLRNVPSSLGGEILQADFSFTP